MKQYYEGVGGVQCQRTISRLSMETDSVFEIIGRTTENAKGDSSTTNPKRGVNGNSLEPNV